MDLEQFLVEVRSTIDRELAGALPEAGRDDPGRLREAMRYAVLGGGKRLRPAVVLGASLAVGGTVDAALPAAISVELLHAYTLIHDDLPAMDDDPWRRGRPTVHVAFGEATAILAGDALLTHAFGALAALGDRAGDAVRVLSDRAGTRWLIEGQARDLAMQDGAEIALEELEVVHRGKTGALFAAAAELGAIAGGGDAQARRALDEFGMSMGVAFQHADDLADGDHPSVAPQARRRVRELIDRALACLEPFGARAAPLRALAEWVAAPK